MKRELIRLYIRFITVRLIEFALLTAVGYMYFYFLAAFFHSFRVFGILFFIPSIVHLILTLKLIINRRDFALYIEKHNDLEEYFISYFEVFRDDEGFRKALEKRLSEILKAKKIKIPFYQHIIYGIFISFVLLEILIIGFSYWQADARGWIYFDSTRYVAFRGEKLHIKLKGSRLSQDIYIKLSKIGGLSRQAFEKTFKKYKVDSFQVKGEDVYIKVPQHEGIYLLGCSRCISALLLVKSYPYIKTEGYVEDRLTNKKRKLNLNDYVLKGTSIEITLKSFHADSGIIVINEVKRSFKKTLKVNFTAQKDVKVRAKLFAGTRSVDTVLYNLHVVLDASPEVVILYPVNTINPVLSDTEKVVAIVKDDIGLSESYAVLYGDGFKKAVYYKKYQGRLADTLELSLVDLVNPLREEVVLRIVGVDVGGKSGYAEVIFRKPTYEDRLKAFMALRDSIIGDNSESEVNSDFEKMETKIKETRDLSLPEREKLKRELEKTLKETERLQRNIENIEKMAESIKELTQDRELAKAIEEFNKTFLSLLDEKMRKLIKELSQKSKVKRMDSRKLAEYIDKLRKNRDEVIKELNRLKEFIEALKEALYREEFVNRYKRVLNKEKLLYEKTKYFSNIKELATEQQTLESSLDSMSKISKSMWGRYKNHIIGLKNEMKRIENTLEKSQRIEAQKREKNLINEMETTLRRMEKALRREMEERKKNTLLKLKALKDNLFFLNMVMVPDMKKEERILYRDALKLSLSLTDSLDPFAYMRLYKAIALLRMAKEFVLEKPVLSYGLVNQAIVDLLKKQSSIRKGGGGARNEIEQLLKRLLARQSGLTKEVSGLLPMPVPLSQGAQSLLSRLGQMQQELRKMAEKLARLQKGKEGRELKKAIEEMKKAEEELKSGRVTRSTLEHQRKALKHLLRAYRSVRKRELSRKRTSTPGKEFIPDVPPLPRSLRIKALTEKLFNKSLSTGLFEDSFVREYIYNLKENETGGKLKK